MLCEFLFFSLQSPHLCNMKQNGDQNAAFGWAFFLDELELSAEDAFSASAPRMGRPNAREEAATDFIRSLLAGGRRLASGCEATLEAAGFKKSTYKKSKKKAGVRSVKDGFLWYWTLPEVEKPIENGQKVTDEDDLPI